MHKLFQKVKVRIPTQDIITYITHKFICKARERLKESGIGSEYHKGEVMSRMGRKKKKKRGVSVS